MFGKSDRRDSIEKPSSDIAPQATHESHVHNDLDTRLTAHEKPPLLREYSDEEIIELEKKLKKKIDTRMLPMIILIYIMNYLDRNNIPAAQVAGMGDELGLSNTQYNTCVSILFVGYILMQVPSNLFLDKLGKPSIYFGVVMIIWGIISGATGAVQNFGGLVACRFFLGFIEAAYFPGCLFYLSAWYTKKELTLRTAILYSGSLMSGAFSGLIAAGITNGLDGAKGLRAWRWLFIIEGSITVFIAFFAMFIIPDFPRTTKWLSPQEQELAAWRLVRDVGEEDWEGSQAQKVTHGLKLAFKDVKMYMLMLLVTSCVSSGSVTNFFPIVVQTLGYTRIKTLLLTTPPYFLATIVILANAAHADRTHERYLHIVIPLSISVVVFIIAVATLNTGARYFAMMLMPSTVYAGYVCSLSWISAILPRPIAKRAAALAAINAVSNASSIATSYMYVGKPRLTIAMSVNCATSLLAVLTATVLRMHLRKLNQKLDRGEEVGGTGVTTMTQEEIRRREEQGLPGEAASKGFRFLI